MQVDLSCCWCCRMILCCSSAVRCARGRDGCVLFLFDHGEDLLADGDDPILARWYAVDAVCWWRMGGDGNGWVMLSGCDRVSWDDSGWCPSIDSWSDSLESWSRQGQAKRPSERRSMMMPKRYFTIFRRDVIDEERLIVKEWLRINVTDDVTEKMIYSQCRGEGVGKCCLTWCRVGRDARNIMLACLWSDDGVLFQMMMFCFGWFWEDDM